jgi:hypothetical protein
MALIQMQSIEDAVMALIVSSVEKVANKMPAVVLSLGERLDQC